MTSNSSMKTTASSPAPPMDTRPMKAQQIRGPIAVAQWITNAFSNNQGQSSRILPANSKKSVHLRLITIAASHFCEKARWALDMVEADSESPIYYTEDGHPPAFHAFSTIPASGNQASATPMMVYPEDQHSSDKNNSNVVYQSDQIIQRLCPHLYPAPIAHQVKDLERELGERMGASLRCHAYFYYLQPQYTAACVQAICRPTSLVSCVEAFLFEKMLHRGIAQAMCRSMKIDAASAEYSAEEMVRLFDEMSSRLEALPNPEKGYLCDTPDGQQYGFTAADLTLAALAGRYIGPPELNAAGFATPTNSATNASMPPEIVRLGNRLRQTTAGKHVLRMYREHRGGNVVIKSVGPDVLNQWPWSTKIGLFVAAVGCSFGGYLLSSTWLMAA